MYTKTKREKEHTENSIIFINCKYINIISKGNESFEK